MNSITIIGCGTLGSSLAYKLVSKSLDTDCKLKQLNLIDYDVIDIKNFPYLTMGIDNEWVNHYKVDVLKHILTQINRSIEISTSIVKYSITDSSKDDLNYIIDCRDNNEECPCCNLKINCDGKFGMVNLKPQTKVSDGSSNYRFGNSRYYADIFAGIVCNMIYSDEKIKGEKTHFVVTLDQLAKENFNVF